MASEAFFEDLEVTDYRLKREVWANAYRQMLMQVIGRLIDSGQTMTEEHADTARATARVVADIALEDFNRRVDAGL